jgi:hypothetical protein
VRACYGKSNDRLDEIFLNKDNLEDGMMPIDEYRNMSESLSNIALTFPNDSGVVFIKRRLIYMEWFAGRRDAKSCANDLLRIARQYPKHRSTTEMMASVLLLRAGESDESFKLLPTIEKEGVSNLPWYIHEFIRDFHVQLRRTEADSDGKMEAVPFPDHVAVFKEFHSFLERYVFPMVDMMCREDDNAVQEYEIANTFKVLELSSEVTLLAFPYFHLEMSKECTDEVLPDVCRKWQKALDRFRSRRMNLMSIEDSQARHDRILNVRIPEIQARRKMYVFNRDFAPELYAKGDPFSSIDVILAEKEWMASEMSYELTVDASSVTVTERNDDFADSVVKDGESFDTSRIVAQSPRSVDSGRPMRFVRIFVSFGALSLVSIVVLSRVYIFYINSRGNGVFGNGK